MEIWPQVGRVHNGLAIEDCDVMPQTDLERGSETSDSGDDNIISQSESVRHLQPTQNSFVVDNNDDALMDAKRLEHGRPSSVCRSSCPRHSPRISLYHHRRGLFPLDKADARLIKHFIQELSPWVSFLVNARFIFFYNSSSLKPCID